MAATYRAKRIPTKIRRFRNAAGRFREGRERGYDAGYRNGYAVGLEEGRAGYHTPFEGTSIIIPTFNQLDYLRECVESIRRHTDVPFEIIVIDNGSTDGTDEYLRKMSGAVRFKRSDRNIGFAGGVNQGLMMARGTTLLFLNNDTIVTENWLPNLLTCLRSDARFGLVGPVTNYISGDQLIETSYGSVEEMHAFAKAYNRSDAGRWTPTDRLTGFCVLMTRDMFRRLGYLDEGFEIGNCEDDDYGLRARLLGAELIIAKDTFIHHAGSKTTKSIADFARIYEQNLQFYRNKWGDTAALADEISRLRNGLAIRANDMYPSHVTVRGVSDQTYWIENGYKYRLAATADAEAVRLSQIDLRNWPEGGTLTGEQYASKLAAVTDPAVEGGVPADGAIVRDRSGNVYQFRGGKLHRFATEWAIRAWGLDRRGAVMLDEAALRFPAGLTIIAPPIIRADNI
jgi:GT2 family glycosyltransferase